MTAVVLCAAFVYAGVKIDGNPLYQRPDWRGVAAALGPARTTRAIVAYDGQLALAPLAIYLPGAPWTGPAQTPQVSEAPVTVGELDIVGDEGQSLAATLPGGAKLISAVRIDTYLVDRFALTRPWHMAPAAIAARATTLLGPAPSGPAVLIQYRSARSRVARRPASRRSAPPAPGLDAPPGARPDGRAPRAPRRASPPPRSSLRPRRPPGTR